MDARSMVRVTNLSLPIELCWPNLRLTGAVKNEKASKNFTRPTRVIPPSFQFTASLVALPLFRVRGFPLSLVRLLGR